MLNEILTAGEGSPQGKQGVKGGEEWAKDCRIASATETRDSREWARVSMDLLYEHRVAREGPWWTKEAFKVALPTHGRCRKMRVPTSTIQKKSYKTED